MLIILDISLGQRNVTPRVNTLLYVIDHSFEQFEGYRYAESQDSRILKPRYYFLRVKNYKKLNKLWYI